MYLTTAFLSASRIFKKLYPIGFTLHFEELWKADKMSKLAAFREGRLLCFMVHFALSFAVIANESSASACWLPTNETLKVQPSDLIVREGENATFTCISSHSNASTSIGWITKPNIYHNTIIESVFDRNSSKLTSTLRMINVGKKSQTIQCYIQFADSEGTLHECYSTVSNLVVLIEYFPRANDLHCMPSTPPVVNENDILSISCQVTRSHLPVELTWETDALDVSLNGINETIGMNKLKQQLVMSHSFHEKTITCWVRSEAAYPGKGVYCSIGPFTVYYKPRLTITPKILRVFFDNNETIVFTCTVDSNPPVANVTWECKPDDIFDGCNSSSKKLELSIRQDVTSNKSLSASVLCSAKNRLGFYQAPWFYSYSSSSIVLERSGYSPQKEILALTETLTSEGKSQSEKRFWAIVIVLVVYGVFLWIGVFNAIGVLLYRWVHRHHDDQHSDYYTIRFSKKKKKKENNQEQELHDEYERISLEHPYEELSSTPPPEPPPRPHDIRISEDYTQHSSDSDGSNSNSSCSLHITHVYHEYEHDQGEEHKMQTANIYINQSVVAKHGIISKNSTA